MSKNGTYSKPWFLALEDEWYVSKEGISTEPCLFGRKSRSKLFQGGDGWFSCGCRFQGRAPWFLHAPTWLELFTFLSGPFPPIFRVFKHSVCFRECISYQPGKKHTNVKWVEHFPIQITFISLTSASAQVYYTTKVKNTTCQSQWHGWSLWLIAWEKRGFVYPPPLPTYISYIAVKLTKQGTSLSYTLGESNPQVLHSHTHTHTTIRSTLQMQGTVLKSAMFMLPSDASSEQQRLLSVGLSTNPKPPPDMYETRRKQWHFCRINWWPLPDFWTINRVMHPKRPTATSKDFRGYQPLQY